MKKDQLILLGAVAFAGVLIAKKTGVLGKLFPAGVPGVDLITGFMPRPILGQESNVERGYDPANPGAYVSLDELIAGASDNDWGEIPLFSQTADSVLGGRPW